MKTIILFIYVLLVYDIKLYASDDTKIDTLVTYSTIYSLGLELNITGDDNHNAKANISYKEHTQDLYKDAQDLYRIDYTPDPQTHELNTTNYNGFAGSILHLKPYTTYDIKLNISDPDGGNVEKNISISTKAIPSMTQDARVLHVLPGDGGGDGSEDTPFLGITEAQRFANPADIFMLHHGHYIGSVDLNKSGEAGKYIVYKAAGDGEVIFDSIEISANYVWLEGLSFKETSPKEHERGALTTNNNPTNVVIKNNSFTGYFYSINFIYGGGTSWFISDNNIVGDKNITIMSDPDVEREDPANDLITDGEGIELYTAGGGHTICNNSISRVADGISSPNFNVDIFGNDIFDVTDDGIELDNGWANVRVWQNRITNARHYSFSFQPMNRGPWYIIQNQAIGSRQGILKFDDTIRASRALIANNTFVSWGVGYIMPFPFTFDMKNNIFVSLGDEAFYGNYSFFKYPDLPTDGRGTIEHNAYDFGTRTKKFYLGSDLLNLSEFQNKTNLELNSLLFDKDTCFENFDVLTPPPEPIPFQYLTLKDDCVGVNKGEVIPNINDNIKDSIPDLGAYEVGITPPTYGVRLKDPTNLRFDNITSSSVTLSWDNNMTKKNGFKIFRDGKFITKVAQGTTTYEDMKLKPDETYTYTIKSTDE